MADEDVKDKSVGTGILGALPSLVGLATSIGTAVPGLKKVNRTDTSRAAAREGSGAVQRGAVAGSQTGFGATRGLNLRTGLRQAAEVGKRTAGELARAGSRDDQRYDRQNLLRQGRLAEYGSNVADMAANFGQSVVDAKAAKEVEIAERAEALAAVPDVPEYDLGGGPIVDPYRQTIEEGQQDLQRLGEQRQATMPQGPTQEQGGPELRKQAGQVNPLEAFYGVPDKATIYRAAPELQLQHSLENLALQEADRQGIPIARVYARIQRMQNLPAIRAEQTRLQLQEEYQDF